MRVSEQFKVLNFAFHSSDHVQICDFLPIYKFHGYLMASNGMNRHYKFKKKKGPVIEFCSLLGL